MPTRVYRMMGVTATFDDRLAPPPGIGNAARVSEEV